MNEDSVYKTFPKIPRLSRDMIVTEKIDGTNGRISISEDGYIRAGSKGQWVTPSADNFGFASWVEGNKNALVAELGPGIHFGEWWGPGINKRKYPVKEKRFSLFNVSKWKDVSLTTCLVVPVLYEGPFDTGAVDAVMQALRVNGSLACPGFMNPEGVVIFHKASGYLYKKTFEADHEPKSVSGV